MTKAFATAAMILLLAISAAFAGDHRPGDAALGALSGAVVLGPVGLVAGAVVGYTAGPADSRSWRAQPQPPRPRSPGARRDRSGPQPRPTAPLTHTRALPREKESQHPQP